MIAPGGHEQQGFADCIPALSVAFEKEPSDPFGVWRSTGLARPSRRDPGALEHREKQPRLRRFAGAFTALDRNKAAAGNRAQCR
jgi:hypothetical protein